MGTTATSRRSLAVTAIAALLVVILGSAAPALAQDGDPYGGTTTTTQPPSQPPTCELATASIAPGETVIVHLHGVAAGSEIRLQFDGSVVARDTAASGSGYVDMDMSFVVPAGAKAGAHAIVAVGPNHTVVCVSARGDVEVLSASESRGDSGGSLPKTGIYVALFVAIALALLVVGRSFTAAGRARRDRASRDADTPRHRQPAP